MAIKINQKADGFSITVEGVESDTVDYGSVAELILPNRIDPKQEVRYLAAVEVGEEGEKDDAGNDLSGQSFPITDFWAYMAIPIPDNEIEFVEEEEEPETPEPATPNITQVNSKIEEKKDVEASK